MFKKNFIRLCAARGESPSAVCKKIGVSPSSFSQWSDNTIPRKLTQINAADYFGITVDELLADDPAPAETKIEPTGNSDELPDDIKIIAGLVGRLSPEQLSPVLSIAANIGKLTPDQLNLVADLIKNMVK